MMFVLQAHIIIGSISFTTVNEVVIKRSINEIGATAKITIPASAYLGMEGEPVSTSVETAQQFKEEDEVTIELGYNADMWTEFVGVVKRVNYTTPVVIECEDAAWYLRRKDVKKSWQATTLKEVLAEVISGTPINLSSDIADIDITNFEINSNGLAALGKIKTYFGLAVYFNLDGSLYAGLSYLPDFGTVKYRLRYNTIKDNDLKYRKAEDIKLKAKAIHIKKDNTKIEVEVGDSDGEMRTLYFYDVESESQLKELATQELEKYKYDGFEGKITTFLQPFAIPAMTAEIEDIDFPARSGSYYIEGTEVRFGTGGARRIIDIGRKMNPDE